MARHIYKSIKSTPVSVSSYLKEVWLSRGLILSFAKRDLKIQYAQTYLGLLWSLIQPLTGLVIFSVFFQKVIPLHMSVPYAVFAFSGIMGWFYFTSLVGQAGTSLMNNRELIRKINFPRLVLPVSKAVVGLVEFSISLLLLMVIMAFTQTAFSFKLIFLPLVVFANVIIGLSVGIWMSALTIRFRDLHQIIPFLIGFGIWLTPVFYPVTIVPSSYNWIYFFHPVANVISLYRWMFIGLPINVWQIVSSFSISIFLFISGLIFFIHNENFVADYL